MEKSHNKSIWTSGKNMKIHINPRLSNITNEYNT